MFYKFRYGRMVNECILNKCNLNRAFVEAGIDYNFNVIMDKDYLKLYYCSPMRYAHKVLKEN